MRALILLCISHHMKFEVFEVHSFTDSNDIVGCHINVKKRVTWPWPRLLGGSLSSQGQLEIYSTSVQNLATLALAIPEILLRALKLKMGLMTLTKPLLRVVCHPKTRT